MLRQLRSNYVRPAQLRIRVNMGRYQQPTSAVHKPEWNVQLIRKTFFLLMLVLVLVAATQWGARTLVHSGAFVVRRVAVQGNRMSNEVTANGRHLGSRLRQSGGSEKSGQSS
jgi:hypothetical protein